MWGTRAEIVSDVDQQFAGHWSSETFSIAGTQLLENEQEFNALELPVSVSDSHSDYLSDQRRYFYVTENGVRRLTFLQNLDPDGDGVANSDAPIQLIGTTMQGLNGQTVAVDKFHGGNGSVILVTDAEGSLRFIWNYDDTPKLSTEA